MPLHSLHVCLVAPLSPSWCWSGPIQSKTLPSLLNSKLEDPFIVHYLKLLNLIPFISYEFLISALFFLIYQCLISKLTRQDEFHYLPFRISINIFIAQVTLVLPLLSSQSLSKLSLWCLISAPLFPLSRFYVISFRPWSSYLAVLDFSNVYLFQWHNVTGYLNFHLVTFVFVYYQCLIMKILPFYWEKAHSRWYGFALGLDSYLLCLISHFLSQHAKKAYVCLNALITCEMLLGPCHSQMTDFDLNNGF